MKIVVIGAHGKVRHLIALEAEKHGHEISAIVRKKHNNTFKNTLEKI